MKTFFSPRVQLLLIGVSQLCFDHLSFECINELTGTNQSAYVEDSKLLANDGTANDGFGWSVSLAGNRALIGSYLDDDNASNSGSAYVFVFADNGWSQSQKLTASDGSTADQFGYSVSIVGDRALIGAPLNNANGDDSGAAYIFDFDGVSWQQTQKLTPLDGDAFDEFGYSVSLVGDWAIIGTPKNDDNGVNSGSAYVFEFDGLSWHQSQKLITSDATAGDNFGSSVSLTSDRVLVGAHLTDGNGVDSGAAYVFALNGTSWVEEQKLTAADGEAFDVFGGAVSLSGSRALIGASLDDDNGENSGSAYVFEYDGINWQQTQKLIALDGAEFNQFGSAVSISGDRALVGAHLDDKNGTFSGSAYLFEFSGQSWHQSQKIIADDVTAFDSFAKSVSQSGELMLLGVPGDDDNGTLSGSVYVYADDLIFQNGFDGP